MCDAIMIEGECRPSDMCNKEMNKAKFWTVTSTLYEKHGISSELPKRRTRIIHQFPDF